VVRVTERGAQAVSDAADGRRSFLCERLATLPIESLPALRNSLEAIDTLIAPEFGG